MEDVLWYLLASSRGGPTRARILRAIEARPRNANQLATALDLDYTTVRHHTRVLRENNVLRKSDDDYAAVYLFTDRARANWETLQTVLATVEGDEGVAEDGTDEPNGATEDGTDDETDGGTDDGTDGTDATSGDREGNGTTSTDDDAPSTADDGGTNEP